ncbi:hypothetical protein LRR18_16865, partial [Mangrovimonas sp. AS39]|uniref:hypothetical protein n=1 Tax=Mangrovimonas futianensis TaxID=2895523 RepID=UPI001E49A791
MLLISFRAPIEVVSEANMSEHHMIAYRRHKKQKKLVKVHMSQLLLYRDIPVTIKLIRISSRKLDAHDNLHTAFKYVVDAIADILNPGKAAGRADDSKLFKWEYAQEKGKVKEKSIRVEIYEDEITPSNVTNSNDTIP